MLPHRARRKRGDDRQHYECDQSEENSAYDFHVLTYRTLPDDLSQNNSSASLESGSRLLGLDSGRSLYYGCNWDLISAHRCLSGAELRDALGH
jgi:hypothetical protein